MAWAPEGWAPAWLEMDAGGCFWQLDWKWLCCHGAQRLKARARLSSTLILLCWPTPLMRWPGLGHEWLHADKSSRGSRTGCAKGRCTSPSVYPVLVLCAVTSVCNKYNPWNPGQMNCPLYCCGESFLVLHRLSMQRGADVYALFMFKSQNNKFDSQGWHLIICSTSQVKFRAKFRTSVWTECHDTGVYLLHNMPHEHVMFNLVKNNCTLT